MRRFRSKLHFASAYKFEAIAAISAFVLTGLVLKPAPRLDAEMLNLPADAPPKQQATSTARVLHREKQIRQIRPENYDLEQFPLHQANEAHWRNILWTTAVVEPQEPFVAEALNQLLAMTNRRGLSDTQVRTVDMAMKVATQLYLSNPSFYKLVGERFLQTIEESSDPEWVAVSLSGLAKQGMPLDQMQRLGNRVRTRFPGWSSNVFLHTTLQEISDSAEPRSLPPLSDLLKWAIAPQQPHLYVLCRPDRKVLCRAILKGQDGQFVRQQGRLWSVPLLLESIHSLGWNFTRGQTPQGIFRIEGVVPRAEEEFFRAYGQFALVNLFVPFEAGAKQFVPGQPGSLAGGLAGYQALFPPSWRSYRPIQQSYWAGKAGRGLFRLHGSGESPSFFNGKDKNYPDSYEWNPTIGCLSARELYSEKGKLIQADMPKILRTLQNVGGPNFTGYLVVVDIPADTKEPVACLKWKEALPATTPSCSKSPPKSRSGLLKKRSLKSRKRD
ncbi:MAG: hypothetical protein HC866_12235 [Leptolyngbyaceae cyanobacterium RU_5_1]|nr:hypothetical protein [Leptolyngbyaceae cyanobacterium RU_5_1]